jgi:phage terminase large subunit-like protein
MPLSGLIGYPGKAPADYLTRTVARLTPPPEELARLSRDQLLAVRIGQEDLKKVIEADPVRFWRPNPGGQFDFSACCDPATRVYAYFAGNKSGKTNAGAIRHLERRYGGPLWDRPGRKFSTKVPSNGVIFAEDFDSHKEVTLPSILTWAPAGFYKTHHKNSAGQVVDIQWANGSISYFRTYDQGSDKAEGKDWDDAWCDEPPPRDLFTAIFRGLVVHDGKLYITATLLKEAWLFDIAEEQSYVKVFEGTIHDNVWLSESAKADFLASLDDDERQVRETGRPKALVGLVYKNFTAHAPFVIEDHELPQYHPIILGVDPHERKPVFALYGYVDPNDRIVWFKYVLATGSEREIFEKLSEAEEEMPSHPVICYMDPNRGKARQKDGTCWADTFEEHGYYVELPDDDLRYGHTCVRSYLDGDEPKMIWTQACLGKTGPVHAMCRYAWEDISRRRDVDAKEKPKDRYKDWPDIHRYVAVSKPSFDVLTQTNKIIRRLPDSYLQKRIRAYA